ncbi:MAG: hypothetical protein M3P26_10235 [Gemmatimonadota bacterium]|nr:hypothetical protein [Gemmatimonadota bacterium]
MPNATKRQVEAWWYVLMSEREKPKEEQSRFLLKPLTQAERMGVWDDNSWVTVDKEGKRTITPRGFQQAYDLCLTQITQAENFPLNGPQSWPTSRSAREVYLEMLDDMDVFEIGNAVREKSVLEVEAKNS